MLVVFIFGKCFIHRCFYFIERFNLLFFLNLIFHKLIILLDHLTPLINGHQHGLIPNHVLNLINLLIPFRLLFFILIPLLLLQLLI